ncbi:MAG: response regulator [Candidatus Hydrogenedens sp.]|nr:response regulator [Candidatus Hydrogenedens sp.]
MPIHVLMAEDNADDAELTHEALVDSKLAISLHHVTDGVEALAFLRKQPPYEKAQTPDLVLLDLNMPRKDGREVLRELRGDPALRHLPVVILTTSGADEDVEAAYELSANCYIQKPVDFEQFIHVVQAIEHFWFTVVKLPHGHPERA